MKATPEDVAKESRGVRGRSYKIASMKATPEDVAKGIHGGQIVHAIGASTKATPEDVAKTVILLSVGVPPGAPQ